MSHYHNNYNSDWSDNNNQVTHLRLPQQMVDSVIQVVSTLAQQMRNQKIFKRNFLSFLLKFRTSAR